MEMKPRSKSVPKTELEMLLSLYGSLEAYNEEQRRCGLAAIEETTRRNPYFIYFKGERMRNPDIELNLALSRMAELQQEAEYHKLVAQVKKEQKTSKPSFWQNLTRIFMKKPDNQTAKPTVNTTFNGAKPSYTGRDE
jgi:hypothetical protein